VSTKDLCDKFGVDYNQEVERIKQAAQGFSDASDATQKAAEAIQKFGEVMGEVQDIEKDREEWEKLPPQLKEIKRKIGDAKHRKEKGLPPLKNPCGEILINDLHKGQKSSVPELSYEVLAKHMKRLYNIGTHEERIDQNHQDWIKNASERDKAREKARFEKMRKRQYAVERRKAGFPDIAKTDADRQTLVKRGDAIQKIMKLLDFDTSSVSGHVGKLSSLGYGDEWMRDSLLKILKRKIADLQKLHDVLEEIQ